MCPHMKSAYNSFFSFMPSYELKGSAYNGDQSCLNSNDCIMSGENGLYDTELWF